MQKLPGAGIAGRSLWDEEPPRPPPRLRSRRVSKGDARRALVRTEPGSRRSQPGLHGPTAAFGPAGARVPRGSRQAAGLPARAPCGRAGRGGRPYPVRPPAWRPGGKQLDSRDRSPPASNFCSTWRRRRRGEGAEPARRPGLATPRVPRALRGGPRAATALLPSRPGSHRAAPNAALQPTARPRAAWAGWGGVGRGGVLDPRTPVCTPAQGKRERNGSGNPRGEGLRARRQSEGAARIPRPASVRALPRSRRGSRAACASQPRLTAGRQRLFGVA